MQFDETLRYLLSLGVETLTIKLGLRNTELLLAALGDPQKSLPAVQIAGTNGKGSTAVVLDSICKAAGIKTGLYTSPHLISITERIKVAGREISAEHFALYATQVRSAAERLEDEGQIEALPTFFEHVTAIAMLAFREGQVELAILETGLGGRLDATSVAGAELVAITPIERDHEEYLGETLESIAAEKAAIIRPGSTAIIAPQPAQALDVILRHCKHVNVQPSVDQCRATVECVTQDGRVRVTVETEQDHYENVLLGLRGRHQITNVTVAIRLAEFLRARGFAISRSAIIEGVETASHAGRLELWKGRPSFLFDGAHNPSGTRALREYLDEFVDAPVTLVFGAMRDKNLEQMAENLFPAANRLVLTKPDSPRAASLDELEKLASHVVGSQKIFMASSLRNAIREAIEGTPPEGLVCFSGSLYLIGEAQALIKEMSAAEVPQ
ncbi:MAG: bifunctional folylpolyglutamate synthase/dihydrofolate synthase [Pyrinomonadaceae bacterium]|nr:bifunctional folylpolyglutamate synthase/dihydrofolate synthase [Pyrinomonadaceae bacterium]